MTYICMHVLIGCCALGDFIHNKKNNNDLYLHACVNWMLQSLLYTCTYHGETQTDAYCLLQVYRGMLCFSGHASIWGDTCIHVDRP